MSPVPYIVDKGVLKPYGTTPVSTAGTVWKSGRPTVIHAMGDSLTRGQGSESTGGYRKPLWDLLTAAGKSFTTTGARNDVPGPSRWSGDGGWRIQELAAPGVRNTTGMGAVDWVRAYPADVILLHIGTNNVGGTQIPNAVLAERLEEMLDAMWPFSTQTHVFIASPMVQLQPQWPGTKAYDAEITKMVQAKIATGRPYHLVTGMDKITVASDYSDPIHLGPTGYQKMAQCWADALLAEK